MRLNEVRADKTESRCAEAPFFFLNTALRLWMRPSRTFLDQAEIKYCAATPVIVLPGQLVYQPSQARTRRHA